MGRTHRKAAVAAAAASAIAATASADDEAQAADSTEQSIPLRNIGAKQATYHGSVFSAAHAKADASVEATATSTAAATYQCPAGARWGSFGGGGGFGFAPSSVVRTSDNSARAVRRILRRYGDDLELGGEQQISEEAEQLMRRVFAGHPNKAEKEGSGIASIWVKHKEDGRCFSILRTDGTWGDFAWRKCFQQEPQPDVAAAAAAAAPQPATRTATTPGVNARTTGEAYYEQQTPKAQAGRRGGSELLGNMLRSSNEKAVALQEAHLTEARKSAAKDILRMLQVGSARSSPKCGPCAAPLSLSKDEFLLVVAESREDAERGADRHNLDTFGEDAAPGGGAWDFEGMLAANRCLVRGSLSSKKAVPGAGMIQPVPTPPLAQSPRPPGLVVYQ